MNASISTRIIIIIVAFIVLIAINAIPLISIAILPTLIFALILVLLFFYGFFKLLKKMFSKDWKYAIYEGILLITLTILLFPSKQKIEFINNITDYVTLAYVYPRISNRINMWPSNMDPKLVILETGGVFATGHGIAYDNSKEIEKLPGTQSAVWQQRAEHIGNKCWEASHLIGNYYRWSADYGCQ